MQPGRSTLAVGKESKAGQCIFILDFLCVNLQDRKKEFAERMTRHTPHTTHHTPHTAHFVIVLTCSFLA